MSAAFVLVGSLLILISGRSIRDELRFAYDAVSTDGTVLTKEITPVRNYEATYRFMVPEGVFEGRARLSYDDWVRLEQRQAVEVLYLPKHPGRSRLAGPRPWRATDLIALAGFLLFVAGATSRTRFKRVRNLQQPWRANDS